MNSNYVIQQTEKSNCHVCGKPLYLMSNWNMQKDNPPAFYICFDCKSIREVGVGIVRPLKEDEKE